MRDLIRLVSSAGTGHFYTTDKNKRTTPDAKPATTHFPSGAIDKDWGWCSREKQRFVTGGPASFGTTGSGTTGLTMTGSGAGAGAWAATAWRRASRLARASCAAAGLCTLATGRRAPQSSSPNE